MNLGLATTLKGKWFKKQINNGGASGLLEGQGKKQAGLDVSCHNARIILPHSKIAPFPMGNKLLLADSKVVAVSKQPHVLKLIELPPRVIRTASLQLRLEQMLHWDQFLQP